MLFAFVSVLAFFAPQITSSKAPCTLRVYSTMAEIIRPLDKLPLEFSMDDWSTIRPDSITLLGDNLNITSQTRREIEPTADGAEVYVRSPVSPDKTSPAFVKAVVIDGRKNLVKVEDEAIRLKEALYFTVAPQDIFYLEKPTDAKVFVDFTYNTSSSQVFVSYMRSGISWKTHYQLFLNSEKSDLIAMANIRNEGKSLLSVDQAELLSGDINLRMGGPGYDSSEYPRAQMSAFTGGANVYFATSSMQRKTPTIDEGLELAGVHFFSIDKPFVIDAKTSYILPMFRPHVTIRRYAVISKIFSPQSAVGTAQRSYCLRSDRYLSQGNCIIREQDRIVGETFLPNLAAKNDHEFSIGQDAEITFSENVTMVSETQVSVNTVGSFTPQSRVRAVYDIRVQVNNRKNRSIHVKYRQTFQYINVTLVANNKDGFDRDGLLVNNAMKLKANTEQVYSYTVECIRYG